MYCATSEQYTRALVRIQLKLVHKFIILFNYIVLCCVMLCYVVLYSVEYLYLPLFEWCQVRINPHRPVHYNMLHSSLTPSLTHSSTHSLMAVHPAELLVPFVPDTLRSGSPLAA